MTVLSATDPVSPAGEARGHFLGSKWQYRRILWGAMLALIVTLGLHRFTVTTNIRRYLWSRTDLAGEQLDYTGSPIDLLLGFLVLVVLLAPLFVVIALFGWAVGEQYLLLLFLVLVPLVTLGLYQARRYRLNHTVFRGLCFRQTGSAWIYVLRVVAWSVVVILTFGFAYPWARADLERYKMRNTYYGDLQGSFVGSGWTLIKRGVFPWLAWVVLGLGPLLLIGSALDEEIPDGDQDELVLGLLLLWVIWLLLVGLVFYPIFRAVVVRWRIESMRFGALSFETGFSTWRFVKAYLKFYGWLVLLAIAVGILSVVVQSALIPRLPLGRSLAVEIAGVVALVIAYFSIATIIAFAFQGTVRFETWRLIVDSLTLRGIDQLDRVKAPAAGSARRRGRIATALNLGGL